jgi:peptidyl-dipeptidase A
MTISFRAAGIPALIAAALLLVSCEKKQEPVVTQKTQKDISIKDELYVYLDSLEREYEKACLATGTANWNSYSGDAPYNLDSAKGLFAKIFLDSAARATVEEWRRKSGSLADQALARRLEMWHRCFIGGAIYADPEIARLENQLQSLITGFKFKYQGRPITRAEVSNRLRTEKDQKARHALWAVNSQLSAAAAAKLVKLVKLRNEKAAAYGFPNYYSLSLHLQAIDEEWLVKTLNALEAQTRSALRGFIDNSAGEMRLKKFGAWDFDVSLKAAASIPDEYFPADSVFPVIHRFEKAIGFDVDSLPIKEVVRDIPYGGLSLAIRIPDDSRFLVNPTRGKNFYATAFHEYGHSLRTVHTDVAVPILKGYEWVPGAQCAAYEEGVAELHAEFTEDNVWLGAYSKAPAKVLREYLAGRNLPALYRLRRLMKDFFFEYEMYKNPDQDLALLEKAMYEKYLLVTPDEKVAHTFASSIWYTSYPCYYQNYILSAMIATQLQEALSDKFGHNKFSDPGVSAWMVQHLYRDGETVEWTERIRRATGKSLETGAYLRKLSIDPRRSSEEETETRETE